MTNHDQITHEFLVSQEIIRVIHIRKPTATDDLYDGVYTTEGKPVFLGTVPMEYIRTVPGTEHHLFRCAAEGCPLKTGGTKAIIHCDAEIWQDPKTNPAGPRSVAGKPLAKFRATRDRRIPVLYGIDSDVIRHRKLHTIEMRRPKIDDLENVGFPARFLVLQRRFVEKAR